MQRHNRNPNDLVCHICGWEFKERSNLRQHMESHGNNKTKCEVCDKVLSIRYLQEHMKIHIGNKEFQCTACGKQFVSRERLKRHNVRTTVNPSSNVIYAQKRTRDPTSCCTIDALMMS